jgi:hypothetical protein
MGHDDIKGLEGIGKGAGKAKRVKISRLQNSQHATSKAGDKIRNLIPPSIF